MSLLIFMAIVNIILTAVSLVRNRRLEAWACIACLAYCIFLMAKGGQ